MKKLPLQENSELIFDEEKAILFFKGNMRFNNVQKYSKVKTFLNECFDDINEITLDFRDLEFLNSSGITVLSLFLIEKKKEGEIKKIIVIGSNKYPWQDKGLGNFCKIWPTLEKKMI